MTVMDRDEILERMRYVNERTVQHRGPGQIANILQNVTHLAGLRPVPDHRPLERVRAIIVAAGPSLDRHLDDVRELRDRGGYVIACNSALPCLAAADIRCDMAVSIEALPMLECCLGLADHERQGWRPDAISVDWCAHPSSIEAAHRSPIGLWSCCADMTLDRLIASTGSRPIRFAGSAVGTAIEIALEWGSADVIVVGHDLSIPMNGGRVYAAKAPWGSMIATIDRENEMVEWNHPAERGAMHLLHGVPAPAPRTKAVPCRSPDGMPVLVGWDWFAHLEWLATRAKAVEGRATIRQLGRAGVAVPNVPRADMIDIGPGWQSTNVVIDWAPTTAREFSSQLVRVDAEIASALAQQAGTDCEPDGESWAATMLGASGVVRSLAQGDWIGVQNLEMSPVQKMRAHYAIQLAAADWIKARFSEPEGQTRP